MHLECQFFILNKRWSSSLGLFYHVPLKRDHGDWDWRLGVNDTPSAIGCTSMMRDTAQESSAQRRCRARGWGLRVSAYKWMSHVTMQEHKHAAQVQLTRKVHTLSKVTCIRNTFSKVISLRNTFLKVPTVGILTSHLPQAQVDLTRNMHIFWKMSCTATVHPVRAIYASRRVAIAVATHSHST